MNLHTLFKKTKKFVTIKIKTFIYRINSDIFDKEYSEKLIKSKKWFENVNFNLNHLTIPDQSLDDISFIQNDGLPKLAWCTKLYNGKTIINYGPDIYKHDEGIIEGVWDSKFQSFDYVNSKHVFGSGVSVSKNKIILTPPSHMYECIFCLHEKATNKFVFSNSLSFALSQLSNDIDCLLELVETARINNDISTKSGVLDFEPLLFDNKDISLYGFYYHNICISKDGMEILFKENVTKFLNFEAYNNHLLMVLNNLIDNGHDNSRKIKYFPLSSISKGYDSPAVTSLIKKLGSFESVTVDVDICGVNDSGSDIAKVLGISCHPCEHPAGKSINNLDNMEYSEKLAGESKEFIATLGLGDDLVFSAFDNYLSNSLFFSGALGDSIWGMLDKPPYGIPVRIFFGKSLNEFRLRKGFVHVPLPVIGSVFPYYIYRINFLKDMKPFSIRGNYNRPIPRRIIEQSGVSRDLFAKSKNAINPKPINLQCFKEDAFKSQISKYTFIEA